MRKDLTKTVKVLVLAGAFTLLAGTWSPQSPAADDPLVASPSASQSFKTKKSSEPSSVLTQEELDEQALEGELESEAAIEAQSTGSGGMSIYDPAAGATFNVNAGAGAVVGTGTTAVTPERSETAGASGLIPPAGSDPGFQILNQMLGNFYGTNSNPGSFYSNGTEANYGDLGCVECNTFNYGAYDNLPTLNTATIKGFMPLSSDSRLSPRERCYSRHLMAAAKKIVQTNYSNREASGGKCALGVRECLDSAQMKKGGGLGHAIQFQSDGHLQRLGFRKVAVTDPVSAPVGSVLVFSGPRTSTFLRSPASFGNNVNGSLVGHVTIRGDDGYFYTDGRTAEAAVDNRTLEGAWVMSTCNECPPEVKNKCSALSNTPGEPGG